MNCTMRIIQVARKVYPATGGLEKHVWELSRRLKGEGHYVRIVTSQRTPKQNTTTLPVTRVTCIPMPRKLLIPSIRFLSRLKKFAGNSTILHLHYNTLFGEPILFLCKKIHLPTVVTLHSDYRRTALASRIFDAASMHLLNQTATRFICLTNAHKQEFARRGLSLEKIAVIPNAIDIQEHRRHFSRASHQVESKEKTNDLLFVGNLDPRKNVGLIIRAITRISQWKPRDMYIPTLTIVGSGRLEDRLKTLVEQLNMGKYIRFLGQISRQELFKQYALSRVVVIPSRSEGVPTVALEAMVCGKPIIATRITGMCETVIDGETGLLAKPDDVDDFAEKIIHLLKSPHLQSRFGKRATKEVQRYSWEKICSSIIAVYDGVLECKARA